MSLWFLFLVLVLVVLLFLLPIIDSAVDGLDPSNHLSDRLESVVPRRDGDRLGEFRDLGVFIVGVL